MTMHLTLTGEKLYQKRAQRTLPILVRQALAKTQTTYSALAAELGMPNPRNLNYVLGAIGSSLQDLAKEWKERVPPLQYLVVQKLTGVPGDGVGVYADEIKRFSSLPLWEKRVAVLRELVAIYGYPRWSDVLVHFGLPKAPPALTDGLLRPAGGGGGSGESEAHRDLKDYVARTPSVVGLGTGGLQTDVEFPLYSGDAVDVFFRSRDQWLAVEVKAANASPEDIGRGLFQCVKYQAVAAAMIAVQGGAEHANAALVLENELPTQLHAVRNTLGITVFERVRVTTALRPKYGGGPRRHL
jgi:hypothetical protein